MFSKTDFGERFECPRCQMLHVEAIDALECCRLVRVYQCAACEKVYAASHEAEMCCTVECAECGTAVGVIEGVEAACGAGRLHTDGSPNCHQDHLGACQVCAAAYKAANEEEDEVGLQPSIFLTSDGSIERAL